MDMFENALRTMDGLKEGIKDKIDATKLELAYAKKKKTLEQEQMESEQKEKELAIFQEEYNRLAALDDKHLMVEMIFALRGFYSEVEALKNQQKEMAQKMVDIEADMGRLKIDMDVLKEKKNS